MRILAITNLYPRLGHETRATYNRAQLGALARWHEVRAIAPVAWTDKLAALAQLDPRVSHYRNRDGIWVDHPWYFFPPRVMQHRYGEFFLSSIQRTATRVVREFQPEIILGCWAHPDGWAAVQLGRQFGIPVVIKVVGSDVLVATRAERRRIRIAQALREASGVVAVSEHLAQSVVDLGVDRHNVHVVPEGIDEGLFSPGHRDSSRQKLRIAIDGPVVLFVGNLLLSKGAGVLIEACGKLKQKGREFRCYLVGQGRDEPALRSLIARNNLERMVTLAGPCPQTGLADWYRASDLVALPSFSEGIPNVLREAMVCGRRFVATAVGGIPEITTAGVGRLVTPGDTSAFADALDQELCHPADVDAADVQRLNISWEQSACLLTEHLHAASGSQFNLTSLSTPVPVQMETTRISTTQRSTFTKRENELDPLHILIVTNLYPNSVYPLNATYNRQQFKALASQHDVRIIAPISWTTKIRSPLAPKTKWYRNDDGIRVIHPTYYFPPKVLENRWGQFYFRSVAPYLEEAIRERRPDVILACWAHPDGWAAAQVGRKHGIPVIVKVHGSDVLVATRNARRRWWVADSLRESDGVIAVSDDLARHVVALGVNPSRVHVVQNGIDSRHFHPGDPVAARLGLGLNPDGAIILFVGNLLLSKGAGVLIEACRILKQRNHAFHCYLVGHGRDEHILRTLIARNGLQSIVKLSGAFPQSRLADWYRASNVVALPSFSEGIPNVLREAMMCGRRFVATAVGGIPEITSPGVGRLVVPGDTQAFAEALSQELSQPSNIDVSLGQHRNISWEQSATLMASCLRGHIDIQPRRSASITDCHETSVELRDQSAEMCVEV